jgi:hypothetical protein
MVGARARALATCKDFLVVWKDAAQRAVHRWRAVSLCARVLSASEYWIATFTWRPCWKL